MRSNYLFAILFLALVAATSAMEAVPAVEEDDNIVEFGSGADTAAMSALSPISGIEEGPNFVKGVHFLEMKEEQRPALLSQLKQIKDNLLILDGQRMSTITNHFDYAFVELKAKQTQGYAQAKGILETTKKMKDEIAAEGTKDLEHMTSVRAVCKKNQDAIIANIKSLNERKQQEEEELAATRKAVTETQAKLADAIKRDEEAAKKMMEVDMKAQAEFFKFDAARHTRDQDLHKLYSGMNPVCWVSVIANGPACIKLGLDKASFEGSRDSFMPPWESFDQAMNKYMADPTVMKAMQKKFQDQMGSEVPADYGPPPGYESAPPAESLMSQAALPPPGDAKFTAIMNELDGMKHSSDKVALDAKMKVALSYHDGILAEDKARSVAYHKIHDALGVEAKTALDTMVAAIREAEDLRKVLADLAAKISRIQRRIWQTLREIKMQTVALAVERMRCWREEQMYNVRVLRRMKETAELTKLESVIRTLGDSKLPKCTNDCTSLDRGSCSWKGSMGTESFCVCKDKYTGDACEKLKCPGVSIPDSVSAEDAVKQLSALSQKQLGPAAAAVGEAAKFFASDHALACSGRGTCSTTDGACTCKTDFLSGALGACELKKCPGDGTCGGPSKGVCNQKEGKCFCGSKFYGDSCEKLKCPGTGGVYFDPTSENVCEGHGQCQADGTCKCDASYTGASCKDFTCPDNCSGKGVCDPRTGKCTCNEGFRGTNCTLKRCPSDCSNHGNCDGTTGKCVCHTGYSGKACLPANACHIMTANWVLSFDKKGMSECPPGSIMRGLWKNSCEGIYCLEFVECAKACEGVNDPLPLGGCYNQDSWTGSFDHAGLSKCNDDTFMTGLWRGDCQELYCIELAKCCEIKGAVWRGCSHKPWSFDGKGWYKVETDHFMVGISRDGDLKDRSNNQLRNITGAQQCRFTRPDEK